MAEICDVIVGQAQAQLEIIDVKETTRWSKFAVVLTTRAFL